MTKINFFIFYKFSWVILILVGTSINKIEILNDSTIVKIMIMLATTVCLLWVLYRQLPKQEHKNSKKSKIVVCIIAIEVLYAMFRGLIPEEIIPNSLFIHISLRYVYSLVILLILLTPSKIDHNI